jgi:hypothetical protein
MRLPKLALLATHERHKHWISKMQCWTRSSVADRTDRDQLGPACPKTDGEVRNWTGLFGNTSARLTYIPYF